MSNLPKYALEIKNRQFSRSGPQNFTPVRFSDDIENDDFNNNAYADPNMMPSEFVSNQNNSNQPSEVDKLREIITDLQDQISRLRIDDTETDELEQQIENERLNGLDFSKQVEEASQQLKGSQDLAKAQEDEVSYFESVLSGKNELATAKENMLNRLHAEYDSLMRDYKRILGTTRNQTIQIRQAKEEIESLQREIQDLHLEISNATAKYDNFSPPPPAYNDFRPYLSDDVFTLDNHQTEFDNNNNNNFIQKVDFPDDNQVSPSQVNAKRNNVPAAMRDSFGLSFTDGSDIPNNNNGFSPDSGGYNISGSGVGLPPRGPFSPVRTGTPRAMADNISFQIDNNDNSNQNGSGVGSEYDDNMTIEQIRTELKFLMQEKEETEKIVNRSPPKGMPISRARRIRQENEDKLDMIDQKMGKLRLLLKQRNSL